MDSFIYYNELYDLYKNLLTSKQRMYFEDYYFNNLSLSEMAENYNISRNAISRQLNTIRTYLESYEQKLLLKEKKTIINSCLKDIKNKDIYTKLSNLF